MQNKVVRGPQCPTHKLDMIRHKSQFSNSYWWGCPNYPACTVTCAEHPDGSPMSTPADDELKTLRKTAHELAEQIWGKWEDVAARKKMYDWLKRKTTTGHIGKMDKAEIQWVIYEFNCILKGTVSR